MDEYIRKIQMVLEAFKKKECSIKLICESLYLKNRGYRHKYRLSVYNFPNTHKDIYIENESFDKLIDNLHKSLCQL